MNSAVATATGVTAVLSMLHEDEFRNSATRNFRAEPVLSWTIKRLCRSQRLGNVAILCWEDQLPAVEEIAEEHHAFVLAKGPRQIIPSVQGVAAACRWNDGWRGGLLSTCHFDLGFYAPWVKELTARLESGAVLLVDPAAGLIDPALVDRMIDQAKRTAHAELCFSQAAPGLSGALIKPALLDRLATSFAHPGRLLHYMPDQPMRDPIGGESCVPVATTVARSTQSFRLNSDRQIERVNVASINLNGALAASESEDLVQRFDWPQQVDHLPREITIELNTTRRSSPIFWPGRLNKIERKPAGIERWAALFAEAAAADDVRLTIGGIGDPLESDLLFQVIDAAKAAGIGAIHVQTDLLTDNTGRIERLVASEVDVVSVNVPAMSVETYTTMMGIDGFRIVLQNIAHFIRFRHTRGRGVPLLVPVFTKTPHNLAEMEVWYDQWLKTVGCAVIDGPSDFAGQMSDVSVGSMAPPRRIACARLASRMNVLCDGSIVACEQDILGKYPIAQIGEAPLSEIWTTRLHGLRSDHAAGEWSKHPLCATCSEWHRP